MLVDVWNVAQVFELAVSGSVDLDLLGLTLGEVEVVGVERHLQVSLLDLLLDRQLLSFVE